jgi:hypothetical protein
MDCAWILAESEPADPGSDDVAVTKE